MEETAEEIKIFSVAANPFARIRQQRGWTWEDMAVAMDLPHTYRHKMGAKVPLYRSLPAHIMRGLALIGENPQEVAIEYLFWRHEYAAALRGNSPRA